VKRVLCGGPGGKVGYARKRNYASRRSRQALTYRERESEGAHSSTLLRQRKEGGRDRIANEQGSTE